MDSSRPALVFGFRTLLGLLLSVALAIVGVGLGWMLFVFFGATSHAALLALFMGGAAMGAAAGGFLAWLRLDNNTPPLLLGTAAVVLLLAGVAGAWGGFHFGSQQEVPCCAGPEIGPMTYTVLGAVAASNGLALLLGVIQALRQVSIHRPSTSPTTGRAPR